MEFVHPLVITNDIIAVYKLTFDRKWFYIGSSGNLRNRIYAWETMFRDIKRIKYKKIKDIFPYISIVELEILQIFEPCFKNFTAVREEEKTKILENWGNPLLLNTSKETMPNQGVTQFDRNEIIKFNSIADAAKYNNVNHQTIRNVLNSKCGYYKGYFFKYA